MASFLLMPVVGQWMGSQGGMGDAANKGLHLLYGQLNRHAFMMAVDDVFALNAMIFFCTLALVFLIRRPTRGHGMMEVHG